MLSKALEVAEQGALAGLTLSACVSTLIHVFKQDEKPWAKAVNKLCFNVVGFCKLVMGYTQPSPPEAK
jgi:hypothetical protein